MIFIIIAAIIFAADLLIKNKISVMSADAFPKRAGKYFNIERTYNSGFAGSLMDKRPETVKSTVFLATTVMCIGSIPYVIFARKRNVTRTGLALMMGGAASNAADRKYRGHVVDYLRTVNPKTGRKGRFIFNFSDACIGVGSFLVLIGRIFKK